MDNCQIVNAAEFLYNEANDGDRLEVLCLIPPRASFILFYLQQGFLNQVPRVSCNSVGFQYKEAFDVLPYARRQHRRM